MRTARWVGAGALGASAVAYRRALRRRPAWEGPLAEARRAGRLWVRTLGVGPPVLLLHGLVGSGRFWGRAYEALARDHQLVVPDLLGFGHSDRPTSGYGPDDHVDAVLDAMDELGVAGRAVLGAHSLGCVIALRLAAAHPDRVARVVGFGPPLYPDAATARRRIGGAGPMAKLFVLPGPAAERACRWVCDHREFAASVARWTHPSLPPALADDAVEHTWESYSETMKRCLLEADPAAWLAAMTVPVLLVAGSNDPVVEDDFLTRLVADHASVTVERWPGDHRLPLTHPDRCRELLEVAG